MAPCIVRIAHERLSMSRLFGTNLRTSGIPVKWHYAQRSERKEMQGEWIGTRQGPGSDVCLELPLACSLKTPSRAGSQVYHTVSRPRRACPIPSALLLHGLDTVWFVRTARIGRGRRWTGAADGGRQ